MTVWFDVEDLFQFLAGGHARASGIQRVGLEIYRALVDAGHAIGFVRHVPGPDLFEIVEWSSIAAAFARQDAPADADEAAAPTKRHGAPGVMRRVPEEIRVPLLAGAASQQQALAHLGRLGASAAMYPARQLAAALRMVTRPTSIATTRFAERAKPGDALLVLGSPWHRLYGPTARVLRDEWRIRFGVLVHDLVPVRHPEWVDQGVRRVFEPWYVDVLPHCDIVFANSQHTAADVEAFMEERALHRVRPVWTLPMGSGFGAEAVVAPSGADYVLFVATMEARKNHALAVKLWSLLLEDERAGRRPPGSTPDLVFAGRVGWLVADLLQQLQRTDWLEGRIRLVEAPTDAALHALYAGSRFTLFPSLYEGWGLPVTESLALGRPCVCSHAAALPEAGGRFCRYFDPDNLDDAYRVVTAVLDDAAGLEAWAAEIRLLYRPVPWAETAASLLEAVSRL